jgi:hypothetical protein
MAYAGDLKSLAPTGMRVRVPPPAPMEPSDARSVDGRVAVDPDGTVDEGDRARSRRAHGQAIRSIATSSTYWVHSADV